MKKTHVDDSGRVYAWDHHDVPPEPVVEVKPVMSTVRFSLICGESVFTTINAGAEAGNTSLKYLRHLLDQAAVVDFNEPEIYAMVAGLVEVGILTQEKFDELLSWTPNI